MIFCLQNSNLKDTWAELCEDSLDTWFYSWTIVPASCCGHFTLAEQEERVRAQLEALPERESAAGSSEHLFSKSGNSAGESITDSQTEKTVF